MVAPSTRSWKHRLRGYRRCRVHHLPYEGVLMQASRAKRHEAYLRTVERHIGDAADAGVCRATVHDSVLSGSTITIDGAELVNFGSCMYMGLNVDPRLKQGAIDAIERFGPVYSSSPVYTSVDLYTALRQRLETIFGHPVAIPTTTTLGHLGVLPVLITPDDAVLIDHQAHTSMHMATQVLIANGAEVSILPHNDMDMLEATIQEQHKAHDKVWYLTDGVYSMFGDMAPVHELEALQRRYENLWVYYDDAHGFGWRGAHGRGYVLEQIELNDRMVVAVSLSKSFGTGGAAVVFPDAAMVRRVQVAGGTFLFSGPIHPAEPPPRSSPPTSISQRAARTQRPAAGPHSAHPASECGAAAPRCVTCRHTDLVHLHRRTSPSHRTRPSADG